jgi:hypothetical protein
MPPGMAANQAGCRPRHAAASSELLSRNYFTTNTTFHDTIGQTYVA